MKPKIDGLAENPRPPQVERLSGPLAHLHRLRVGDYRVLYQIEDAAFQVLIVRVRHRREAYR